MNNFKFLSKGRDYSTYDKPEENLIFVGLTGILYRPFDFNICRYMIYFNPINNEYVKSESITDSHELWDEPTWDSNSPHRTH